MERKQREFTCTPVTTEEKIGDQMEKRICYRGIYEIEGVPLKREWVRRGRREEATEFRGCLQTAVKAI